VRSRSAANPQRCLNQQPDNAKGGHVRLRSEPGHGTTVTIYLPRHHAATGGDAEAASSLARASAGAVVLVVDDEPSVLLIVTSVLSSLGYTVLEACDGRSGLQILTSSARIDLLLTDVGLPGGMNGRQMADAARQVRPSLKVLFMTGYAANAAIGNGEMEQGMHVMIKPFRIDALAAKVKAIAGS